MEHIIFAIVIGLIIIIAPLIVFGLDKLMKPNRSIPRAVVFMVMCGVAAFDIVGIMHWAYIALQ
jgi:hypothetical protein